MYRAVFLSGTASVCRGIYISIHIYNLRQDYPKKRRHDYNMGILSINDSKLTEVQF